MADYTSKYYGAEIDSAVGTALALKDLRGIIKITANGPVAAVANEDYIADSSSIVNVAGILKGVADAETGKIVVHKAEAGIDYQTPLNAGIDYATPTAVANKQNKINTTGLLKGTGEGVVTTAEAGVDYATSEQAKPFVVTFTLNSDHTATADKTIQEIITAHKAGQMVLGIALNRALGAHILLQLFSVVVEGLHDSVMFTAFNIFGVGDMLVIFGRQENGVDEFSSGNMSLAVKPVSNTALPNSGTALTANTIYEVADAVGTYAFTPPSSGWAHGKFTTGSSASVSFAGTFLGAAPSIEASKTYEFDVYDGVWAVQEVVSA